MFQSSFWLISNNKTYAMDMEENGYMENPQMSPCKGERSRGKSVKYLID